MAATDHPSAVPASARPYQGRRAGIVTRVAAAAVDLLLVIVAIAGVYLAVAGTLFVLRPARFHWPQHFEWSLPVMALVVAVPYLTLTWCTTGRSYGDALFGLRVVNRSGHLLNIGLAFIRALFYVIFPVGLFWVAVSRESRSVQDLVLRTSVIYDWTPQAATDSAAPVVPLSPAQPDPTA
jgi:uncharacterized RDD family membrane protein YckC